MQILFFYNPNDYDQNQGINFSPEYYFMVDCVKKQDQIKYILSEEKTTCREDIFADEKLMSVTAIVGKNGSGKTTLFRRIIQEFEGDALDDPIHGNSKNQFIIVAKETYKDRKYEEVRAYYKIENGTFESLIDRQSKIEIIDYSKKGRKSKNVNSSMYDSLYNNTSLVYFTNSYYEKWAVPINKVGRVKTIKISPTAESIIANKYFRNITFRNNENPHTDSVDYFWKKRLVRYNVLQGLQRIFDLLYYKRMKCKEDVEKSIFYRANDGFKLSFASISSVLAYVNSDYLNYKNNGNPWKRNDPHDYHKQELFFEEKLYWNGQVISDLYKDLSEEDKKIRFLYYNLLFEFCIEYEQEIPKEIHTIDEAVNYINGRLEEKNINRHVNKDYYVTALKEVEELVKIAELIDRVPNEHIPEDMTYDRLLLFKQGTLAYDRILEFIWGSFHEKETFVIKYLILIQDRISSGQRSIQNISSWLNILPEIELITGNKISVLHNDIIVIIDEIDLYLHPEWQRRIVNEMMKELKNVFSDNKHHIQLIFSTHSPLCLSDIPNENTVYLYSDDKGFHVKKRSEMNQTFGREVYLLLKDSFFLSNSMGERASNYINCLLKDINELRIDLTEYNSHNSNKKAVQYDHKHGFDTNGMNVIADLEEFEKRLKDIRNRTKVIGNDVLNVHIQKMIDWITEDLRRIGSL